MKLLLSIFTLSFTLTVLAQTTESYSGSIVSYIEEEARTVKQGDYYVKEVQCTGYCAEDKNADNKLVAEAKGKSQSLSIAGSKASMNCKVELVKQCPGSSSTKTDAAPFSCDWLDGRKLLGTATHKSVSCNSTVCAGELVCTGGGLKAPMSSFVICEAPDNKCPEDATQCYNGSKVEELKKNNFDVKYGKKNTGAVSE